MDITVTELERITADDVVTTVHWNASVTDGDYFANVYGTQSFTRDSDSAELVPFADLTEAKVVSWLTLESGLEANLLAQIEEQKNPTNAFGIPW